MLTTSSLLALAGLAQAPEFQVVHQVESGPSVAFVHVVAEVPEVRLDVYARSGRLSVWPERSNMVLPTLTLAPGERFRISIDWRTILIPGYEYPCLSGAGLPRMAQWTTLRLPLGVQMTTTSGHEGTHAQLRVEGAATVAFDERVRLLAFRDAGLPMEPSRRVRLFRRATPQSPEFTATGEYRVEGGGTLQIGGDGSVIVQEDGPSLRVLDWRGEERARLPSDGRFFLAADGRWLASWLGGRLQVHELSPEAAVVRSLPPIDELDQPHEVGFLGQNALVRGPAGVVLFALPGCEMVWRRSIPFGTCSSVDLLSPSAGRLLVAVGARAVQSAPMRASNGPAAAGARASVEVYESALPDAAPLLRADFDMVDWTHSQPEVRLVGMPPRLLVVTADRVLLSAPLP